MKKKQLLWAKAAPESNLSDNMFLVDRGILLCGYRQRLDRVVPLAMECGGVDLDRCHLRVADLDRQGVAPGVESRLDAQPVVVVVFWRSSSRPPRDW
jgi:hypothetical protein